MSDVSTEPTRWDSPCRLYLLAYLFGDVIYLAVIKEDLNETVTKILKLILQNILNID